MSPNDANFFGFASGLCGAIMSKLPPGHHITLIIRHETDKNSGMVITSEPTERPGRVDLIVEALRSGLSKAPSAIVDTTPTDPSQN